VVRRSAGERDSAPTTASARTKAARKPAMKAYATLSKSEDVDALVGVHAEPEEGVIGPIALAIFVRTLDRDRRKRRRHARVADARREGIHGLRCFSRGWRLPGIEEFRGGSSHFVACASRRPRTGDVRHP
jgi:hypothetical protein